MASEFSPDERIAAMRRAGIGEPAIQRWAKIGGAASVATDAAVQIVTAPPPFPFPLRLVLPWTALVSDNSRMMASLVKIRDVPHPRMLLTAQYKTASEKIRSIARAAMLVDGYTFQPLDGPLQLDALVWVPGGSARNDVVNFAKGVHDALQKICYHDDRQLEDTRWRKAGKDVDRPRAELTITPL